MDVDDLVDARRYAANGYPHDAWTALRRESPVHWCEPRGYRPFWAVTRHADIRHISSHPEQFQSAPRTMLLSQEIEAFATSNIRSLVNMDPPDHRDYRALAAPFLKPSAVRSLESMIRGITHDLIDEASTRHEPFDFVFDFAVFHPLKIICQIIGAAAEDEDLVLRIANTAFGLEDPEYAANLSSLLPEMMEYYRRIKEGRLARPTNDLYGALVHSKIGGEPIPDMELVSYFLILTSAGHDTTRNALAGGLAALLDHPDELERLREAPSLCRTAADEILRWTSPVIQFCRTPVDDVELGGHQVRAGETLALFYPSANRDEEVFDEPFRFDVGRDPNPHLGFGVGEHFCLGAHLARLEIRVLLEELIPRLEHIELAGPIERTAAGFVGGVKHLPVVWSLRDSVSAP